MVAICPWDNSMLPHGIRTNRVCCLGAGYVGGPTMTVMASHNPHVEFYVLDLNQDRIDAWNSPTLPIYEPGLQELVDTVRGKNLFFSTDVTKYIELCDIIFIAVNTPTKTFGIGAGSACDLTNWELAARSIAKHGTTNKIVIEKSTVPVRTAAGLNIIFSANSHVNFCMLSNPEFLAEGCAIRDLQSPDRILIGSPDTADLHGASFSTFAKKILHDLYAAWVPSEKIVNTNLWSSELAKLVANAFLAQRISSINSISAVCEKVGADIREVSRVIGLDSRIGPKFLEASLGFGGSCFKKDVSSLVYIAETLELPEVADYWRQVLLMNDYQKARSTKRLIKGLLDSVRSKQITVLGFAFKKNTADVRETPAADVCRILLQEGAIIRMYDPKVNRNDVIFEMESQGGCESVNWDKCLITCGDAMEAVENSHAIIVCTEWDQFMNLDYYAIYERMYKPALIYDGRNILDHDELHKIGFEVIGIGFSEKIRANSHLQTGVASPYHTRSPSQDTLNSHTP